MQKIIYVIESYLGEINKLLKEGWKVDSLHPVSTHTEHSCKFGAYVVLTK